MPQDVPEAISPLASFEGDYQVPGFELWRRWFDGGDVTPAFRDGVLALIRAAFNDRVSWFDLPVAPEAHFEWKFRDRPVGATVHATVDSSERVVGFSGGVRRIWFVRGRPYVARAAYDMCLSPDWQGQGVQRALSRLARDEWHPSEDLGVAYVTHPADRHLSIEGGYRTPANETRDYVRSLRGPLEMLRGLRGRVGRASALPIDHVSNTAAVIHGREPHRFERPRAVARRMLLRAQAGIRRRPAPASAAWTLSTLKKFDRSHEEFVAEAMSQFDFVAERPIEYLNWRYCDERAGPFVVRIAEQNGAVLGFAVTRVFRGTAQIADILSRPGRVDVAESLIRDATRMAQSGGARHVAIRLPRRHPSRSALARTGFIDGGHVAGELVGARRMPPADLEFLARHDARIHLVFGDSDFV